MIHREHRDLVSILTMKHGKVNAIDIELLAGLAHELAELERSSASAVVFTGSGNSFSAGVDLFRVLDGGPTYLAEFLPTLTNAVVKLFTFPRPVVAAINGHAIAGGGILACACDYRIMASGPGRIGMPELLVGVPFPAIALEILRFAVPGEHIQEILYTGRTYSVEEALERGLIEEMVDPEALLDRACEVAGQFGAIPPRSFKITKWQLRQPVLDRFEQYRHTVDDEVAESWTSPDIHTAIGDYLHRTIGRGR